MGLDLGGCCGLLRGVNGEFSTVLVHGSAQWLGCCREARGFAMVNFGEPGRVFAFVRRNFLSVSVPTTLAYLIYFDYSKTQQEKAAKAVRNGDSYLVPDKR